VAAPRDPAARTYFHDNDNCEGELTMEETDTFSPQLREAVEEALATIATSTGLDADALFGTHVIENLEALPGPAAYAGGFLEGAALAWGLTVLEFLDTLGVPPR
jgi:hypothetical protein